MIDFIFILIAVICIVIGFLGTFLPVLPGVPLAWAGLLAAYFSSYVEISIPTLIITGIVAVVVSVIDNIFPVMFTKQSGGSKAGTWGSTIGLIIGFFIGPVGIILGPFCGALAGELIHDSSNTRRAFSAAFGAFKGFLLGTGIKMISCLIYVWILIRAIQWG